MDGLGCCLFIIIGLVLWVVFLFLAGVLPALGLLTAGMLWHAGKGKAGLLILILSLISALAGIVALEGGFSGPSFLSRRAFPPALFVIAEAALPAGVLLSLVYLRSRSDFEDPRITTSLNAMIVIAGLLIILFILGQSIFSQT